MQVKYFESLNQELKNQPRAIPFLIIDLDKLDQNIETLKSSIQTNIDFRIVVKSLPSPELIDYVIQKANTKKLMVFHQPFLTHLSKVQDNTIDILLGKPMPVKTAEYYYQTLKTPNGFSPTNQLQWLVDTTQRIEQYIFLAKKNNQKLRLNLEIDVGLRRGGFSELEDLKKALQLIQSNSKQVEFSGFMGYDPHVVKLPKIIMSKEKAFKKANDFYGKCIYLLKNDFPNIFHEQLTFNGAGSPTIELHHNKNSHLNDISAGSCLVKPTTFDIPTLKKYVPASFIATPILKKMKGTTIPGIEKIKGVLNFLNKKNRQSYFIYGGFWKADYYYPKGISENELYGSSTNQTMINSSSNSELKVDDFVFLRPHQSEFVFLQFGNILTLRNGKVDGEFSLLSQI
jgi:D-serine deaminase-like pyridoxal phosphate-dependent protein